MSCVLNKVAASGNSIAGAAIGAGLGGLGGYQLGKFLKASEAANALIAAAGALGGGALGYRMGEEDPTGQGRPWHEWDKRNLFRIAGGLGGAGLGVLGNRALGLKNSPMGDLGAAVLMGGLGALGGDVAFSELDQGLQQKLDKLKEPYEKKKYEERKKELGAAPPEEPTSKQLADTIRSGAGAVADAAGELIPEAGAGLVNLGVEGAKSVGETAKEVSKDIQEKGVVQTVKEHPIASTAAGSLAVDAGRYSGAFYNMFKTRQLIKHLMETGRLPKNMTVEQLRALEAFISHEIAGTRNPVGEFFNFRPSRDYAKVLKMFERPVVSVEQVKVPAGSPPALPKVTLGYSPALQEAYKYYEKGGRAARNWTPLIRQAIKPIGSILKAIISKGK